ncbi:catechol 2,3-dioxygenase-like lactoylglutathione lyase family enzyme [Litorimonas taeanensis]|uniref:Catechol 2,3-dioxygenase-like lactoylglutathione lyase family enzyme n=1 Tax=Litorimonas taeanensis TaxID=568099 RepID=A0A420WLH5_9PROT|nr:VOC family protein [Litorimonas taeanensis]RKQ71840.1 catechol 2,3-dioxygenase-like lactoylglutathione lyase family enzyme [Litorimonas taeanensis]
MFSHVMIGAEDVEASKTFYDAALETLGVRPGRVDPKGRAMYIHEGSVFMLTKPIDGNPACGANGGTLGFAAATPEEADAFHKAGLDHGGTAIEDPPGWREANGMRLYLAYLRDPAGNKVCAMCRG